MKSRHSIVVIDNFYQDALTVRDYALRQAYYTPYQSEADVRSGKVLATWWATRFKNAANCPFKSSKHLIDAIEEAVGERVDILKWEAPFPVDAESKPLPNPNQSLRSCLWNCCFHVKPDNRQQLGDGVHNHVTDSWNSVGPDGWAGIIYLSPGAPLEGGLNLWRNINPEKQFDWMTPAQNWQRIDSFGNIFNRLILVRGDVPHSGAGGWGNCLKQGRMYQTFFFHTTPRCSLWPVSVSL